MNEIITSTKNEFVKYAKTLASKKGRKQHSLFLIEGEKCVGELIVYMPQILQSVIVVNSKYSELVNHARKAGKKVYFVADHIMNSICDSKTPQGIAAIAEIPSPAAPENGFILALDDVQDPQNVGTMIRTADAAGCSCVALSEESADCYSPKAVRASMGSIFHIPIIKTNLPVYLKKLISSGYKIAAASVDGELEYSFNSDYTCLIIGNESRGISKQIQDLSSIKIKIPIYGKAESLNAAVAAGILLYKIRT